MLFNWTTDPSTFLGGDVIKSRSCTERFPSPKEKQLSHGYKDKTLISVWGECFEFFLISKQIKKLKGRQESLSGSLDTSTSEPHPKRIPPFVHLPLEKDD